MPSPFDLPEYGALQQSGKETFREADNAHEPREIELDRPHTCDLCEVFLTHRALEFSVRARTPRGLMLLTARAVVCNGCGESAERGDAELLEKLHTIIADRLRRSL